MNTTRGGVARRRGLSCSLLAGVAAAALLSGLSDARAQASKPAGISNTPSAGRGVDATTLDEISVEGQNPTFGTKGFVATRSTAGMKGNDSILETPATVSVITREELDVRGVQDINLATAYTPNILATDYPGGQGAPAFTLRGFRTINFENVFQDGLRYGFNAFDQNIEPYAYERIDVVKGPISVLYGAGQPGGIINLVSKRPTFTPFNEVFIQGGNFNRIQGGFDLSGPVEGAPDFAYRLTGLIRKADTQVAFTPDDRVFLAPAITWRPDSDTSLTVLAKYAEYRRGGSEQSLPYVGSVVPNPIFGRFRPNVFVGQPNFNTELLENKEIGYILDHVFAPGWLFHSAFRTVETSSKYQVVGFDDFGRDPLSPILNVVPYLRDQSSISILADNHVEGQFDTFGIQHNVVFGVDFQNYFRRDRRTFGDTRPIDLYNPVYDFSIAFPPITSNTTRAFQQQTGVYVQDQLKWNGFILTGSFRNDWSDLSVDFALPAFGFSRRSEQSFTAQSYRGALGYEFDFGVVPYVAYSTSFNPQIVGTRRDGTPLDPQEARQIEGGVKYQPPGTNSLFTASYFEITQTNVPAPDPGAIGFFVQTGEATSKGFEFEGKTPLAEGLNLIVGYASIDARITKAAVDTGALVPVGNRLANVPRNAFSLFLDYSFPPDSALAGLRTGAGVRYVGERTNITNVDFIPSYALVDASLSYDLARLDPSWKGAIASINATNLFDERYFTAGFYQGTVFEGFRRSVFGTLTYRW